MRYFLTVLLSSFLALATGCSTPSDRDQEVGRLHRAYTDIERTNWAGDGPRPLATTVWYPASASSTESRWSAGVFQFGRSALNAPFADTRKRPLILMSHGTGGSAAQLSWLAEELVQADFIVAAVNHHGNTAVEDKSWPHGFVLPNERSRDLSALIDKLLADSEIGPRIDPSRIGVAGFSLGGYTVLAAVGANLTHATRQKRCETESANPVCRLPPEAEFTESDIRTLAESDPAYQRAVNREGSLTVDDRIRAAYAIAPAFLSLMNDDDLSSVRVPLRFVLAERDQQIQLAQTLEVIDTELQEASVSLIPDAGHYAFLAPCNLRGRLFMRGICSEGVDRSALHKSIGSDAARFFNASL